MSAYYMSGILKKKKKKESLFLGYLYSGVENKQNKHCSKYQKGSKYAHL